MSSIWFRLRWWSRCSDHLVLGKVEHLRVNEEASAGRYKISMESWLAITR
ncbi:hypothetical protein OM416_16610 [Paenibacillus sp. LS1]|nr:hypothetical protein [Paenibacillus sp. LS1]MCW3793214.1 hypothetical protein [Paenibacillus sp. LS1]